MIKFLLPVLFLLPFTANAQFVMLNQGDLEASGSAGFNSTETTLQTRLGYFVYDYVQVGVQFSWADNDFATRTHFAVYSYQMFETDTYFLPYVGGGLGYGALDTDAGGSESGIELMFLAGVKYYISDNVSLNAEFAAAASSADTYLDDDGATSTEVGIRVGLSYLW
jgi:opacity protein-like surface antigen